MRDALGPKGRLGVIVPTGIATDDTTKFYFGDLVQTRTLVSYFGFKNERFLFPRPVEHTVTFGLLTVVGRALSSEQMQFCWLAWTVEEMADPTRRIVLTVDDIERLNPNTRTCPVFRSERDAEITKAIYRRVPVLIREATAIAPESNPWGLMFMAMFHMANASDLFVAPEVACSAVAEALGKQPAEPPPFLPLYEAKMLHQFDHRWATYAREGAGCLDTPILTKTNKDGKTEPDTRDLSAAEKDRPDEFAAPRYWVRADEIEARLIKTDKDGNVTWQWERKWLLGFRDIARNTDDRTLITSVLPRVAAGHKAPLMFPRISGAKEASCLVACMNAFVVDYAARQKIGGTSMSYFFLKQFPVLPPSAFAAACPWGAAVTLADWIAPRALELVYTAHDLADFARDLGHDGSPYRWDVTRRARIRAELDAAFFHLYGVSRDDAAYIMDTFLVFKDRDEVRNGGVYKTKEIILEIYDAMLTATRTGQPYQTILAPPPADPRVAHPDTRKAVPLSEEQVLQSGRITAYVVLLLREWNRPAARNVLEAALVLMLNDRIRQQILNQSTAPSSARASSASTEFVRGFDGFLHQLATMNFIKVDTVSGTKAIRFGTQAPSTDAAPDEDRTRLRETLKALEIIGEDRARDVLQEIVTESYAVVS